MIEGVDVSREVGLRPVEDRDLDLFFDYQADSEAAAMAAVPTQDRGRFDALRLFVSGVPVRPLHAHVAAHNAGSIRVLQKCGFRRDHEQETQAPVPDDGIKELLFVLAQ